MFASLANRVKQAMTTGVQSLRNQITSSTKPMSAPFVRGSLRDLVRTKPQLIVGNALLRQQLIVLNRSVKLTHVPSGDRIIFVLLAGRLRHWKEALLIVKPETILRWQGLGFRLFWKRKSRATSRAPKIQPRRSR